MLRFNQFIKTIILEAKLEHFVHLNLDSENEYHNELLNTFNNNKEKLMKKHPAQYKDIEDLASAVSPYIKPPEVSGATLIHHNKETGAKVYHVHTNEAACKLSSDTWCTSKGGFSMYDKGRSFVLHLPNELDRNLRKIGIFVDNDTYSPDNHSFQDAANKFLTDDDWSTLRKKHNLDKIPALMGIRGIPISQNESHNRKLDVDNRIKSLVNDPNAHTELSKMLDSNTLSPEHIDTILSTHNNTFDAVTSQYPKLLNKHHIDILFDRHKDNNHKIISNFITKTPHINDRHIDYILNKYNSSDLHEKPLSESTNFLLKTIATKHKLSNNHINKLISNGYGSDEIGEQLANRTDLSNEHFDALYNKQWHLIDRNLIENIKTPSNTINSLIKKYTQTRNEYGNYNHNIYSILRRQNLTHDNINSLIQLNDSRVDEHLTAYNINNLSNNHISTLIDRHGKYGHNNVIQNIPGKRLTKVHLDSLSKYKYPIININGYK